METNQPTPRPALLTRKQVSADESIPDEVRTLILAAMQVCTPRAKAEIRSWLDEPYFTAEGATVTVWHKGRSMTVDTASENTVDGASIAPGRVQLRPGAWLIETYRFWGRWYVHAIEARVFSEAQFHPAHVIADFRQALLRDVAPIIEATGSAPDVIILNDCPVMAVRNDGQVFYNIQRTSEYHEIIDSLRLISDELASAIADRFEYAQH